MYARSGRYISNFVNKRSEDLAHPRTRAELAAAAALSFALPTGAKLVNAPRAVEAKRARVAAFYGGVDAATVYYEDLVATAPAANATWRALVAFLGVAPFAFPESREVVIHANRPALDAVLNKDAVRATLYRACRDHYARSNPNATRVSAAFLDVCRELRRDEAPGRAPRRAPAARKRAGAPPPPGPGRAAARPRTKTKRPPPGTHF